VLVVCANSKHNRGRAFSDQGADPLEYFTHITPFVTGLVPE